MAGREALAAALRGCGDVGCVVAPRPGGTEAGCRCDARMLRLVVAHWREKLRAAGVAL